MKPIIKEKKQAKKKFNWSGFFRYFRTIWKNDACVECSIVPRKKNNHTGAKYWWVSIPVFLASITLAMTPLTVHASQRTGSTMLVNKSFNIDTVLHSAFYQDEENKSYIQMGGNLADISFIDHKAEIAPNTPEKLCYDGKVNYLGFHKGLMTVTEDNKEQSKMVKDFEFFFIKPEVKGDTLKTVLDQMSKKTFKLDESPENNKDKVNVLFNDLEDRKYTSFIAFTRDQFFLQTFGNNAPAASINGDYKHVSNGTFKDIVTKGVVATDPTSKSLDTIMKNFNGFADDVFETNRFNMTGAQSGISLAVNGGIVILLGLILFALTRGKQNPFRYVTCYETLIMAMWATFLPSLLALIFGFIFPGMEMMFFLITFGFRIMWMAMRNLRPQTY